MFEERPFEEVKDQTAMPRDKQTRQQELQLIRNLVSLFFLESGDNLNWINGPKVQLIVSHCIEKVVQAAESTDDIVENDTICAIFDELSQHQSARDFVQYLFKDILENKFQLDSISHGAAEDE